MTTPSLTRRILLLTSIPAALMIIGTLGYYFIEDDYSLFDAFYMTIITLTTVGYGETHPLTTNGRVFTIFLLLVGVFSLFYTATEIVRGVVSGEIQEQLGRQRMEHKLAEISGHMIVCGYGRMGRHVCQEFSRQGIPFVVIDYIAEELSGFELPLGIPVIGDATDDNVLRKAGVDRARGLVAVAPNDADNLYITMSARLLNHKLFIVARAEADEAEAKLKRAGANRVISPYVLGGCKIAQAVLRPAVLEFIELATKTEQLELQIEETRIGPHSSLAGVSLAESRLRQEVGLIVVAIKKKGGAMIYTPPADVVIEAGDTLIALGRRSHLDRLEKLATGKG
jgi:voltage-gated potassium channel